MWGLEFSVVNEISEMYGNIRLGSGVVDDVFIWSLSVLFFFLFILNWNILMLIEILKDTNICNMFDAQWTSI